RDRIGKRDRRRDPAAVARGADERRKLRAIGGDSRDADSADELLATEERDAARVDRRFVGLGLTVSRVQEVGLARGDADRTAGRVVGPARQGARRAYDARAAGDRPRAIDRDAGVEDRVAFEPQVAATVDVLDAVERGVGRVR